MSKTRSILAVLLVASVAVLGLGGCQCSKKEEAPVESENKVPADQLNNESAPADAGQPAEAAPAEPAAQ